MRVRIFAAAAVTVIGALAFAPGASAAVHSGSGHAATGTSAPTATGLIVRSKVTAVRTYKINATTTCKSAWAEYDGYQNGWRFAAVEFSQYFCYNNLIVTYETAGFAISTFGRGWGWTGRTFHKNCYAAYGSGRPCSGNYEKDTEAFCQSNPFRGGCSAYWYPTINQWQKFNGQNWYLAQN